MPDTTIKKVEADPSPKGEMGQTLVAGKRVSLRLPIPAAFVLAPAIFVVVVLDPLPFAG